MRWRHTIIVALISLTGCATTQLNHNAIDLSASLDMLTTQQILHNLDQTLTDEYAVPSQAEVSAGTVTTTNSLTPTFSIPLNTSSVVTAATQTGASMAKTDTTAITHPNTGLTLGGTNTWSQGWTLNPASDPDQIRRLRALYRFATGKAKDDPASFQCEYPTQTISALPPPEGTSPQRLSCEESDNTTIIVSVLYDPNFTSYPSCVICKGTISASKNADGAYQDSSGKYVRDGYYINPELVYSFVRKDPVDKSQYKSLSAYGYPDLYVCKSTEMACHVDGMRALHDFVLFIAEANGQQSASAGGSKSPSTKALGAPIILTPVQ